MSNLNKIIVMGCLTDLGVALAGIIVGMLAVGYAHSCAAFQREALAPVLASIWRQ